MRPSGRAVHDGTTNDTSDVIAAALALEVSEFDVFRLAYRRWHGADADTAWIERVFVGYLFGQRVPPWVRHYCRDALRTSPPDRADLDMDGTVRRRPRLVLPGGGATLVIGVAALVMFVVCVGLDGVRPSMPLSCHGGGPGLRFAEDVAHGYCRAVRRRYL